MPGVYPSDYLDRDGMPRGMSVLEWGDDCKPKKAAVKKAAAKKPSKKS